MIKILTTCWLLLVGFSACIGQVPSDGFFSGAGRFAVAINQKPLSREPVELTISDHFVSGEAIAWKFGPGDFAEVREYQVSAPKFGKLSVISKKTVMAGLAKGIADSLTQENITSTQQPFTEAGLSGIELRATGAGGRMVSRIFFYLERAYVVTRSGRDQTFEQLVEATKIFRLLSKNEYISALIAENTPASLPQDTTGATVVLSDARRDDLKGSVQSVFTEEQEMPKGIRKKSLDAYFDRSGNYVKEVEYQEGYPISVNGWGWIDGKRVQNMSSIEYGSHEGPNEERLTYLVAQMEPPGAAKQQPKGDDRYTYRYSYAANAAGQPSEWKMFQNDGALWQRRSIVYKPGQRETLVYGDNDKIETRYVEILDKDGNVVEESSFDPKGKLEWSSAYRYEFDPTGNWTKRTEFKKVRGKVAATPSSVRYRQISYY